jgi:uncharacterized membrane protein
MESKEVWVAIRQALLMVVDAIEKWLSISPTTSEMRRQYKGK